MVAASAAAGVVSLVLVSRSRFGPARVVAAGAVAAIVAGWGLAQAPRFLPGLTIEQAAAGHSTLVAVVVAAGIGAVVLVPSLFLLFKLFLTGRLDAGARSRVRARESPHGRAATSPRRLEALAIAALLVGIGATVFVDLGWGRIVGVPCLVAGAIATFLLATADLGVET
jgi:cytochrome d ubiquinol oxidase subunit II